MCVSVPAVARAFSCKSKVGMGSLYATICARSVNETGAVHFVGPGTGLRARDIWMDGDNI